MGENKTERDKEEAKIALQEYKRDFAMRKYKSEVQRENALIDQSKNIQQVFSIVSLALITLLPFIYERLSNMALRRLMVAAYLIVFMTLITSLVIATFIQIRPKKLGLPGIQDIKDHVDRNKDDLKDTICRLLSEIDTYQPIEARLSVINDRRARLVNVAMLTLMAGIVFVVFVVFLVIVLCFVFHG